ncbi:elongation factor Ts [bacterium]|jgi:elongation factor Ts|nr:elongation factor Ts [bacterium]
MQITAEQVSKLRERTGAGMMDCKKALTENAGDFDKAVEYLRKKGIASASKKSGRTAKEGAVFSLIDADAKAAVIVEVNCETDFVAKTENFQKFVTAIARHIAKAGPDTPAALLTQTIDGGKTVEEFVKEGIASLGENIMVRRFARYPLASGKEVKSYIHMGGKVGVLVEVAIPAAAKVTSDSFTGFIRDLSMHIAAASPLYLKSDEVPADVVAKEKEIALAQLQGQNKPADVLEKIATGKINKYFEETCLLKQRFVKDDKKTIEALVAETGKALGESLSIVRFTRYVLGEGVEMAAEETHH